MTPRTFGRCGVENCPCAYALFTARLDGTRDLDGTRHARPLSRREPLVPRYPMAHRRTEPDSLQTEYAVIAWGIALYLFIWWRAGGLS